MPSNIVDEKDLYKPQEVKSPKAEKAELFLWVICGFRLDKMELCVIFIYFKIFMKNSLRIFEEKCITDRPHFKDDFG